MGSDTSNDPKYKRTRAERTTLWSGEWTVNTYSSTSCRAVCRTSRRACCCCASASDFEENVRVASLAPHRQVSKSLFEQIVEVHVPQVAEQCVAHFVAVKRRRQCVCPGSCMFVWISVRFSDLSQRQFAVEGGGVAPQTFALRVLPLSQTAPRRVAWLGLCFDTHPRRPRLQARLKAYKHKSRTRHKRTRTSCNFSNRSRHHWKSLTFGETLCMHKRQKDREGLPSPPWKKP